MIRIDKNIAIPDKGIHCAPKYPFRNMKIGDSFAVNLDKEPRAYNRLNVAVSTQHRNTNKTYTIRSMKSSNEVRVWRIK
tara:strand:+ start:192 stop:428 length:237 start_codon:yes stop_codon:yes gene_type:complete